MRFSFFCVCFTLSAAFGQTGSVALRNVSVPFTSLEVGNIVEVTITGATPFGTVTVVQNGQPPYVFEQRTHLATGQFRRLNRRSMSGPTIRSGTSTEFN